MKFIKKNYVIILMFLAIMFSMGSIVYSSYIRTKTNNELFNAYIDSRVLVNKQIDYINELTTYMTNINNNAQEAPGE